ncbi:MAG: adenylate/guanylate cyclase domain-containing protein [Pseudomonadota bacterium]
MHQIKRLSITQGVFAVTLSVAIAIAISIVIYSRHKNREQALVAADQLMNRSIDTLQLRAAALVEPIDLIAKTSRTWPEIGVAPKASGHPSRDRLISLMRDLPQILNLYIGYEDGDFFQVGAADRLNLEQLAELGAPPDTAFIEFVILRSDTGSELAVRRFLDERGGTLSTTSTDHAEYDPRTRPWYEGALESNDPVRTDVYVFSVSQKPGISVGQRHAQGVMGVDITLTELGRFLDAAPEAEQGVLALFQGSGQILARSSPKPASGDTNQQEGEDRVDQVLGKLVKKAVDDRSFEAGLIEVDGELWIARVAQVGLGAGTPENLLVAMPVSQVVAGIDRISRDTVVVSLLIILASVPVIWLIARLVSRPLLRLAADADALGQFDLSDDTRRASPVVEIDQLQHAMVRARASLRTFALYVPKALVKQLIERDEEPELGGSRRDITVLFMDLENFTAMSSEIEPEEVMARMSRYFESVTRTLRNQDATIDKYIGDAVMAFWNAPNETPDHAARACRAALEVIKAAGKETETWSKPGSLRLRTRIGIHCGDAIVGNVGSSDRMNYTALGATVNLAARLETLNRELGTQILVSEAVVARTERQFAYRPAGETMLKGFADPIPVFELVGTAAEKGGQRSPDHMVTPDT